MYPEKAWEWPDFLLEILRKAGIPQSKRHHYIVSFERHIEAKLEEQKKEIFSKLKEFGITIKP